MFTGAGEVLQRLDVVVVQKLMRDDRAGRSAGWRRARRAARRVAAPDRREAGSWVVRPCASPSPKGRESDDRPQASQHTKPRIACERGGKGAAAGRQGRGKRGRLGADTCGCGDGKHGDPVFCPAGQGATGRRALATRGRGRRFRRARGAGVGCRILVRDRFSVAIDTWDLSIGEPSL